LGLFKSEISAHLAPEIIISRILNGRWLGSCVLDVGWLNGINALLRTRKRGDNGVRVAILGISMNVDGLVRYACAAQSCICISTYTLVKWPSKRSPRTEAL
jgi:hypothetical protein